MEAIWWQIFDILGTLAFSVSGEGTYIVLPAKPFGPYEEGGNEEE